MNDKMQLYISQLVEDLEKVAENPPTPAYIEPHLPSSGFDMELCTGDWKTCPYGEYCDCGEEPDFTSDDLPENDNDDSQEDIEMPF